MKLRVSQDIGAGLFFLGFGAVFALGAHQYSIGSPAEMGPGFLPFFAGSFVSAIGLFLLGRGMMTASESVNLYPVPLAILGVAIVVFALSFPYLGLVPSAFVLSVLCARASMDFKIVTAVLVGIVIAAISYVLFILGLGLPFNAWPSIR